MRRLMIALVLVFGAACGSNEPIPYDPPPPPAPLQNPDKPADNFALSVVGWQHMYLNQGASATLQVRYTNNDVAVQDAIIAFQFVGDSKDSTLVSYNARTNAGGVAETTIVGGQILGRIQIEARGPVGNGVEWSIDVSQKPPETPAVGMLSGTFTLTSHFDIQTQFAGTKLGDFLTSMNEISNDPNDPGAFVVGKVLENVQNSAIVTVATFLRPVLDAEVNKLLTGMAPEMVNNLKRLAQELSAITRKFEIVSAAAAPAPQEANRVMKVSHTLKQIAWELNGKRTEYTFGELGMAEPTAENLEMTPMAPDAYGVVRHTIQSHTFDLKFGSFLLVALNEMIIPGIDSDASSISDLLSGFVSCPKVGETMNNTVNLGGELLWAAACNSAMDVVGSYFESKLTDINKDKTTLKLQGITRLVDQNADAYYDIWADGQWTGDFTLAASVASVDPAKNTFIGVRTQ